MGERLPCTEEARGSSPLISTRRELDGKSLVGYTAKTIWESVQSICQKLIPGTEQDSRREGHIWDD
jgi:hypothetical protein